jgi:Na+-transporting NADH:ubiquinone oxidoreductase subunit NqrB
LIAMSAAAPNPAADAGPPRTAGAPDAPPAASRPDEAAQDWRRGWRLRLQRDARLWQIAFQAVLLTLGVVGRDFSLRPEQMLLCFAAGLATQVLWVRLLDLHGTGVLSAVITCLGLSLLLRADSLWVHPLAAALALSAKFTIRVAGKHLFNPANLGVIVGLALLPGAWVSPGQWGNDLAYALWFVALGAAVTQRARRWDISWAFLAFYLGLVALRVAWLGQSPVIWWHQFQSGALLLFAFFMISDPMTIPDRALARTLYAALVAMVAFAWQFLLFKSHPLLWALFLCTPAVPLLDRLVPGVRARWDGAARNAAPR